jgi:porin
VQDTLKRHLAAGIVALCAGLPLAAPAQTASETLSGPDAIPVLLGDEATGPADGAGWQTWKSGLKSRTGLDFGIDYNALGYVASTSLGDHTTAGGVFRIFGKWELVGRGTPNSGGLVFKFEQRHALANRPPASFGTELGYAGLVSSVFSDQGWRTTNLYWQQGFAGGRGVMSAGWLDTSDFVDVFALASPWSGFSNLAFQTGSGTIGGLPDGALGVMAGGFLGDKVYIAGSIVDANGDATDIGNGFDTLFNDGETFKSLELGWTSGAKALFLDNAHLTFWQVDAKTRAATPDGHGIAFSLTKALGDAWLPFLRGGWSEGGGSLYEASLSAGFGYTENPGKRLTGVGLNWSRPSRDTFGVKLGDQQAVEVFSRWQLAGGIEVTPSLQIIRNPALNPGKDTTTLLGLRVRMAF